MTLETYQKEIAHLGESRAGNDRDRELVQELNRRLHTLWRYERYIADAEGYESVQVFWKKVKEQEKQNIIDLKKLLSERID